MNTTKTALAAVAVALAGGAAQAQSPVDVMSLTQPAFRGTARYMGMGGAFTALGGDLSTLTQNPGGIGIYRGSEIGATVDLSFQRATTQSPNETWKETKTKFAFNNFGYVGTARLDNDIFKTFSWGVSYNRRQQFDRRLSGYAPSTETSLTNYIAGFTEGTAASTLNFDDKYNPYRDSNADWLSILAYNSFMINENPSKDKSYLGLHNGKTNGDAKLDVREYGYTDEYSFNLGGNVSDVLMWGIGIGVTDLSYTRDATYSESMENATVFNKETGALTSGGDAGFYLNNSKRITGSGVNFGFGLIVKPVNALRIGASIHTPTAWTLSQRYIGWTDYSYAPLRTEASVYKGKEETDEAFFDWRLKSPWRFALGAAVVASNKLILSAEYEREAYDAMSVKNAVYDGAGYGTGYENNTWVNDELKKYMRAANVIRVGAEYRVTPQFSVRAGANVHTSSLRQAVADNNVQILTSGTDPSYSLEKDTYNYTAGVGYRFGSWYVDAAYVHTRRSSDLHAYTDFDGNKAPSFQVTQSNNSAVVSLGYRF